MSRVLREDEIIQLLDADIRDDDDDERAQQPEILSESEDNLEIEEHQLTDSENKENIITSVSYESSDSDIPISRLRKRQCRIESSSSSSD